MGALEEILRENTSALKENTARVNVYIETTEKALEFQQDLIKQMVSHEQMIQSKWVSALIKWGGWTTAALVVMIEVYVKTRGG